MVRGNKCLFWHKLYRGEFLRRLLDFEEMNEILSSLNNKVVRKEKPIGYTFFNYPIDHYVYGHGKYHVIMTAGTHAAELISNVFVVRFMEMLSLGKIDIDENLYTIHFIPFVNPEGTIIVTETIRTLITRDMSEEEVQTYLLAYYRNCHIESDYALKYGLRDNKLQHYMFRHASPAILEKKHKALSESLKKIFKESNLPDGCMINWSNNGRGVDLNSNIESSHFIDRVVNGEKIYGKFHLNNIRRDKLGPTGCPFYKFGEIEKENIALLNFYDEIKNNYDLIGSFIYHSCGNIVYYLGEDKEKNPWVDLTEKMKSDNKKCALAYAYRSKYKIDGLDIYTTMDAKIKSLFPVTLLIELGGVRATPLSQFMDLDLDGSDDSFKHVYSKIINDNVQAVLATIEEMLDIYREK